MTAPHFVWNAYASLSGYGQCHRCRRTWDVIGEDRHTTSLGGGRGVFVMCRPCWNGSTPDERVEAAESLYHRPGSGWDQDTPEERADLLRRIREDQTA